MTLPLLPKKNTMTLDDAFEKGVRLYQNKEIKEARNVFETLLQHSPDTLPILQVLAVLDAEEGLWDSAINKLDEALKQDPSNMSILFDKAHLLADKGRNKEAFSLVEQLLKSIPTHQELLSLRQKLTAKMGLHAESRRSAKKNQQIKTQKENTLNEEIKQTLDLALQMFSTGNTEEATLLFQTVLNIAGEHKEALLGLAKIQLSKEQFALARQTLLRAFDPAHPTKDLLVLLSHCNIKMKEYKTGREYAKKGHSLFLNDPIFCRLIVQSYEKERNWLEAQRRANKYIKTFPKDADLLSRLATSSFNLLRTRHNFTSKSISQCQKNIERASKTSDEVKKRRFSTYLAEVLSYKGEAMQAKNLLEDYLSKFPEDIEVGFNLSFIYRTLNEWENFYRANELGLACGRRLKYQGELPIWSLERPKEDCVLVMPEQGVGDEILYFHNLNLVLENAKKVYVACDPRLENILSYAYPRAIMVPITRIENENIDLPEKVMNEITSWIAGGSLAGICYAQYARHIYKSPYLQLPKTLKAQWHKKLETYRGNNSDTLLIGICWRSGLAGASRNIHYLMPEEVAHLMKQCPGAVFINLQYDDCKKEIKKIEQGAGRALIQLETLNLRDDFENTAAVISNLDLVITAGTAVHRLTTAVGTECHVFFAGTKNADFTKPEPLSCENEWGYFYPPLLENKYPLLKAIAQKINKKA